MLLSASPILDGHGSFGYRLAANLHVIRSPMDFKRSIQYAVSLLFLLALTAASAQKIASAAPGRTTSTGGVAKSAADDVNSLAGSSQFILGASDVIHVNVWESPELSQTVTVGPDGFVSLPLVGDVHVAGMTGNQLSTMLTTRLSAYVVHPQVTVSVVDIRSRKVYVLGQVTKPGGYPLVASINVLQLIAEAGGLNNFAKKNGILILRPTQGGTQKISFNYNSVVHGDSKQNIDLQPGDTVVVP